MADDTTLAELAARVTELEDTRILFALRLLSHDQEVRRIVAAVFEFAAEMRFALEDGSRSQVVDAVWDLRESARSLVEDLEAKAA